MKNKSGSGTGTCVNTYGNRNVSILLPAPVVAGVLIVASVILTRIRFLLKWQRHFKG